MEDLLKGNLVRLSGIDPDELSQGFARWSRDSEFKRLLDFDPARLHSTKATKEWIEKHLESEKNAFWFSIRALKDDRLLGDIELAVTNWSNADAFVGLGIGERDFWGQGYGTDAMRVILRYGFLELNLRRVTLNVFEYNERAIRSYEKAGFCCEGRQRQAMQREGRRWDILYMGILREEWMEQSQNVLSAVLGAGK
jgi:RimJ/RimL family protein N-acetyltransferase